MIIPEGKSALVREVNLVQVSLFEVLTSNGLLLPCSALSLLGRIFPADIWIWNVIPVLMSDIQPKSGGDSSIFQTPSYLSHLALGADRAVPRTLFALQPVELLLC